MKPSIKQSTYSSYEAYIRVHLKPYLGELDLKDLSPRTLQQFYNYKSEADCIKKTTDSAGGFDFFRCFLLQIPVWVKAEN